MKEKSELKEFENTQGVIRICNWGRTNNTMAKRKRTTGQTTIYKAIQLKLKIE